LEREYDQDLWSKSKISTLFSSAGHSTILSLLVIKAKGIRALIVIQKIPVQASMNDTRRLNVMSCERDCMDVNTTQARPGGGGLWDTNYTSFLFPGIPIYLENAKTLITNT